MEIKMSVIPGGKPGKVGKLNVKKGDKVSAQDVLAQVETGKGTRPVKALQDGTIEKVLCAEGDEVLSNTVMFVLSEETKVENQETVNITEEEEINTDLVIIGGGPGGYVAAIYAAKNGQKVTLVEKDALGGTCLNVGCIPTKALVKSSEICHNVKHASTFGIEVSDNITVNMDQVISRKDEVRSTLVNGLEFLL